MITAVWAARALLLAWALARPRAAARWLSMRAPAEWEALLDDIEPLQLSLGPTNEPLCVLDRLRVQWQWQLSEQAPTPFQWQHVHLVYITAEQQPMSVVSSLGTLVTAKSFAAAAEVARSLAPLVRCASRDLFCQPPPAAVTILKDSGAISIVFSQNTTAPVAPLGELQRTIRVEPAPLHDARLQWQSPAAALLHLDAADVDRLVAAFQANASTVSVKIAALDNDAPALRRGALSFRPLHPTAAGRLFLIDGASGRRISNALHVSVQRCEDDDNDSASVATETHALPQPQRIADDEATPPATDAEGGSTDDAAADADAAVSAAELQREGRARRAEFHMAGVWPVTGVDSVAVTPQAAPALRSGTWSLSLWIRLVEAPTGAYRALAFRGDPSGADPRRTPSLWLLPASNHVTLRLSTAAAPDVAFTTGGEVAMNRWTHLALTVENTTQLRDDVRRRRRQQRASRAAVALREPSRLPPATAARAAADGDDDAAAATATFRFRLFLNGRCELDGVAGAADPVVASDRPLALFHDGAFAGPRAFVQGVSLWDGVLSAADVRAQVARGVVGAAAVDDALAVLAAGRSRLLPFVDQFHRARDAAAAARATVAPPDDAALTTLATLREYAREAMAAAGQRWPPAAPPATDAALPIDAAGDAAGAIVDDGDSDSDAEDEAPRALSRELFDFFARKSAESATRCEPLDERLDVHAESAALGATRGLLSWSKLLLLGHEASDSRCGVAAAAKDVQAALRRRRASAAAAAATQPLVSAARALYLALAAGEAGAAVPFALLLLQGGAGLDGLDAWAAGDAAVAGLGEFAVPWPSAAQRRRSTGDLARAIVEHLRRAGPAASAAEAASATAAEAPGLLGDWLRAAPPLAAARPFNATNAATAQAAADDDAATAAGDGGMRRDEALARWSRWPRATRRWTQLRALGVGLLQVAALHGDADAHVALHHRHAHGLDGCVADDETAAQFATRPVRETAAYFQRQGAQAIVEAQRLSDDTVRDVGRGDLGADDELIELQRLRAQEGDVAAMLAMGDLFYYGARGLPQDHGEALRYFRAAAAAGDPTAMCGVANMLLKGEGAPQNVSAAVAWYENATRFDSVRAFNGLGYLYFYGQHVPQNYTRALSYFVRAASFESDGDALFNAAFCLEQGYGVAERTDATLAQAVHFYTVAATKLGHFGAIQTLGAMHLDGRGVPRSAARALSFFAAALGVGPWHQWLRRGFDLFLVAKDLAAPSPAAAAASAARSLSAWLNPFAGPAAPAADDAAVAPSSHEAAAMTTAHVRDALLVQSLFCYLYAAELGECLCLCLRVS